MHSIIIGYLIYNRYNDWEVGC